VVVVQVDTEVGSLLVEVRLITAVAAEVVVLMSRRLIMVPQICKKTIL
jgi:hypothetical protein|tara:strand:+ start:40 stop:183 length:144 start_codon:yes stop_codon:yes gene_type:complete